MSSDDFERCQLDPDTLAEEALDFYDADAAQPAEPVIETEAELLDPDLFMHDVHVQTPGSLLLAGTIDLSFIEN